MSLRGKVGTGRQPCAGRPRLPKHPSPSDPDSRLQVPLATSHGPLRHRRVQFVQPPPWTQATGLGPAGGWSRNSLFRASRKEVWCRWSGRETPTVVWSDGSTGHLLRCLGRGGVVSRLWGGTRGTGKDHDHDDLVPEPDPVVPGVTCYENPRPRVKDGDVGRYRKDSVVSDLRSQGSVCRHRGPRHVHPTPPTLRGPPRDTTTLASPPTLEGLPTRHVHPSLPPTLEGTPRDTSTLHYTPRTLEGPPRDTSTLTPPDTWRTPTRRPSQKR